jgi:hypothetical protein
MHFQKVLDMCNQFCTYVTSIRREDERKRARAAVIGMTMGEALLMRWKGLWTFPNRLVELVLSDRVEFKSGNLLYFRYA